MIKMNYSVLLREWTKRLGLTDWRIKVKHHCSPDDMPTVGEGCVDFTESTKCAMIYIIDPVYYGERIIPFLISEANKLPAVPQEMSAREFFEEFQRMCLTVDGCSDCPVMGIDKCAGFPCRYRAYIYPDEAVAIVERWAQEHPKERSKK